KSNGAMVTGWLLDGKTWYYLKSNGAMATGWIQVGKTWYYLRGNGAMAANTWIGKYYVNKSGAWTKTR
ncbi:Putative cell wall binding repeat-containing protein, partial [Lactonifactor longoviformis DSM 17459]